MKKFKIPADLGSDFKNPIILDIKELTNHDAHNGERTFTSDCCCNTECHDCGRDYCVCECVIDTGCHLNPFKP